MKKVEMVQEKKKQKKRSRVAFLVRRIWEAIKRFFTLKTSIYHRKGSHIITGYPGAGKTLMMNKIVNDVNPEKYFFISNVDEFYQDNVIHYNVFSMFENNTQVAKLPLNHYNKKLDKNLKLYGVILDEINLKYNKRLNRSKSYNDSFVGLIEFIITHRHQGIPRVYFIGQKLELQDTQLQSLFKYWHNIIFNKMKPSYPYYRDENKFIIAPRTLFIENFIKGVGDEYTQEDEISEVKITYEDLKSYNTLGLAQTYETLPVLMSEYEVQKEKEKKSKSKAKKA